MMYFLVVAAAALPFWTYTSYRFISLVKYFVRVLS